MTAVGGGGGGDMDTPLKLRGVHHVGVLVGNVKQGAFFYREAFGFSQIVYAGLETGSRERTSYVLQQAKTNFVFTTPLGEGFETDHVCRHGDGVRDVAIEVEDADFAYAEAIRRGGIALQETHEVRDDHGTIRRAVIRTEA